MKIIRLNGSPVEALGTSEEEYAKLTVREVEREMIRLRDSYEKGEIDEALYRELLEVISHMVKAVTDADEGKGWEA